ncbi:MAG: pyruvate ferredoxin oxidoreductase, partial [Limisphaerales bacterium]
MSATESVDPNSTLTAEPEATRAPLTKKEISADHPTWCPGCGDFSILALYFKLIQQRGLHHEKVTTVAGIG